MLKDNRFIIAIVASLVAYYIAIPFVTQFWKAIKCDMDFVDASDDLRFGEFFKNWEDKSYAFQMGREKGEYAFFSFREKNEHFVFHTFEMPERDLYKDIYLNQGEVLDDIPDFLKSGYRTRTMDISNGLCFSIPSKVEIKIDGELTETISKENVRVWKGYMRKLIITDEDDPLVMFADTKWNIGSKEILVVFRKDWKLFLTIIKGTTDEKSADKALSLLNLPL